MDSEAGNLSKQDCEMWRKHRRSSRRSASVLAFKIQVERSPERLERAKNVRVCKLGDIEYPTDGRVPPCFSSRIGKDSLDQPSCGWHACQSWK